jgi:hypothetical protein
MAGKSANSLGAKNWAPNPPATRYNVSGKNREFYTFENAPGVGAYATGGTIIDGGDGYIYHIFTGNGTFAVNRPPAAIDSVDYLIVAGGGAIIPGTAGASGGGGGGGMLFGNISVSNAPGSYAITIGAGGASVPNVPTTAGTQRNGSPSEAFGLVATGGGSGGNAPPGNDGRPGGSGGGGGFPAGIGGSGNTPATIPRQGYPGATPFGAASGGGGAGGVGVAGGPSTLQVGAGGPGRIAPEFPSTIVRQAIPAPLLPSWEPLVGPGGFAAGGSGTSSPGVVPAPLTRSTPANSGYGGQGGDANAGGSGIVCVRYKKTAAYSRATGGVIEPNTHPEHPGVWRHIFTEPGAFEVTDPTLQWIDYLAVGGGGGGGESVPGNFQGSGGGAGGFVSSIHTSTTTPTAIPEAYPWNPGYSVEVGEQYPVGVGTYPVVIGAGGTANTTGNDTTIGNPGGTQIIAYGGGGGRSGSGNGNPGGSGSGASKAAPSTTQFTGGTASPSPLIQGNPGSYMLGTPGVALGGGGGGAGAAAVNSLGGAAGWYSVLSPSAYGTPGPLTPTPKYRYFAGGGSGGTTFGPPAGGGGGGWAPPGVSTPGNGSSGTTNTGGGGGGAALAGTAGAGGPGIVIIQYPE